MQTTGAHAGLIKGTERDLFDRTLPAVSDTIGVYATILARMDGTQDGAVLDQQQRSVCVIIPTKNRAHDLSRCLEALVSQVGRTDRIVVIDNGSTDETPQSLARYPNIDIIVDPTPSLSRILNKGWRNCSEDVIAFLNDDAVADKDWIVQVKLWFQRLPDAAAISGPVHDKAPRRLDRLRRKGSLLLRLYDTFVMEGRLDDYFVLTPWGGFSIGRDVPPSPVEVGGLSLTNMAVKRDVLEATSGFDEDLSYANIDGEFFLRLQRLGLKMFAVPTASVQHYVSPVGATRSAFFLARDQAVFLRKLRPVKWKDRLRLHLNAIAFLTFWLSQARHEGLQAVTTAIRGYWQGIRDTKSQS